MRIVASARTVVEVRRHVHVKPAAWSRQRDVKEAALLGDPLLAPGAHVGGEVAVVGSDEVNGIPFKALGRVDGAEHQVVLVEVWPPRQIGAGRGWVEHEL